jgi:signal peptidase I
MILTILFFIVSTAGLWRIFSKAGKPGWHAVVPFLNIVTWIKVIGKPKWWIIPALLPFVNVFLLLLMVVETLKCFKHDRLWQITLAVLFPFVYIPFLGFSSKEIYTHPSQIVERKKSASRDWAESIIFALVAATIIRTFFIEAYVIPTPSMENSLLVGDHLFVSKLSYGPRVPLTPIAFPLVHHTIFGMKSYTDKIQLPYYRFPGLKKIKNNDIVVFNFPVGDTLSTTYQSTQDYYALVRQFGRENVWNNKQRFGDIITRPIDKRENFIKRCVAIGGDTLQIIDGQVFINGQKLPEKTGTIHNYKIKTTGAAPFETRFTRDNNLVFRGRDDEGNYYFELDGSAVEKASSSPHVISVERIFAPAGNWSNYIYPHNPKFAWNIDNFGPLYIPKKGETIELTDDNVILYERVITAYEGNQLDVNDSQVLINGAPQTHYTFKQDYYWLMGDNRINSLDSRAWGFVPEDHVVGSPVFVWLNRTGTKINFKKSFRLVD